MAKKGVIIGIIAGAGALFTVGYFVIPMFLKKKPENPEDQDQLVQDPQPQNPIVNTLKDIAQLQQSPYVTKKFTELKNGDEIYSVGETTLYDKPVTDPSKTMVKKIPSGGWLGKILNVTTGGTLYVENFSISGSKLTKFYVGVRPTYQVKAK